MASMSCGLAAAKCASTRRHPTLLLVSHKFFVELTHAGREYEEYRRMERGRRGGEHAA